MLHCLIVPRCVLLWRKRCNAALFKRDPCPRLAMNSDTRETAEQLTYHAIQLLKNCPDKWKSIELEHVSEAGDMSVRICVRISE